MVHAKQLQFAPAIRFTRYAEEWLPEWATHLDTYDKELCACDALPVFARCVTEVILPRNQGIRKVKQRVCPACIKLLAAERKEFDQREANILFDSLQAPERRNDLYTLRSLFDEYSKPRLKFWQATGLVLSPQSLTIGNNKRPTPTVYYDTLIAWMKNPLTWHSWHPEGVKDKELRAWISQVRKLWPWQWVPLIEVATSLGYSRNYLLRKVEQLKGLRGPKPTPTGNGGSGFYVRSDVVEWFKSEVTPETFIGRTRYERIYGDKFVRVDAYLPESYHSEIRLIGGNNFSSGVRKLLEHWRKQGESNAESCENRSKPA